MKSKTFLCLMFLLPFVLVNTVFAQDAEELSQQAANPIANLISLPFQNNANYGYGQFDRTTNILNIQPVVPLANGKIVTRTIFPIVWIPDYGSESGTFSSGLSDITFTAFYVPESKNVIWGVGPVIDIPTGGEKRGSQKWNIGPSFLALVQPGDWTFGILANNVWSFAGKSEALDVNRGLINLFIVRQLGEGWYIGNGDFVISYSWQNQSWFVPFGLRVGKAFINPKGTWNTYIEYRTWAIDENWVGPVADHNVRINIQYQIPVSL